MDTTARPLSSIGIDIGKEVFHVVGFGTDGKIAFRRKIIRREIAEACSRAADAADEPLLGRLNILQCAAGSGIGTKLLIRKQFGQTADIR